MRPIIDVSQHNGSIDWEEVKPFIDSAVIRLGYRGYTDGHYHLDKRFDENVYGCMKNGISYSVYYFPTDVKYAEAIGSARWINDMLTERLILCPVWLDSEIASPTYSGRSDKQPPSFRSGLLAELYSELRAYGYQSGVYCSDAWCDDSLDMSIMGGIPFWIARYSTRRPRHDHIAWQYSSKVRLPGISGFVDCSVLKDETIDTI